MRKFFRWLVCFFGFHRRTFCELQTTGNRFYGVFPGVGIIMMCIFCKKTKRISLNSSVPKSDLKNDSLWTKCKF
jgi:hypothetical protein